MPFYELWTRRKSSLRQLHVWGCLAEARLYNPHEKRLDARTFSGSSMAIWKVHIFYYSKHRALIVEAKKKNRFIQNGETGGSDNPKKWTSMKFNLVLLLAILYHCVTTRTTGTIFSKPIIIICTSHRESENIQENIVQRSKRQKRIVIFPTHYSIQCQCFRNS